MPLPLSSSFVATRSLRSAINTWANSKILTVLSHFSDTKVWIMALNKLKDDHKYPGLQSGHRNTHSNHVMALATTKGAMLVTHQLDIDFVFCRWCMLASSIAIDKIAGN